MIFDHYVDRRGVAEPFERLYPESNHNNQPTYQRNSEDVNWPLLTLTQSTEATDKNRQN